VRLAITGVNIKALIIMLCLMPSMVFGYTPPKGIPNPSGSFSTFGEIDQSTPSWPTEWTAETKSEKTNYYYIDKTEAGCSNSRSYGYPGYARCLPVEGQLQAGAYVYFHGGTYTGDDAIGDRYDWYGTGTASNPIWITGRTTGEASTRPKIQYPIHLGEKGSVSYFILENLTLDSGGSIKVYGDESAYNVDHVIVRNNKLTGRELSSGESGGILIGGGSRVNTNTHQYIVVYNNEVHGFGDNTAEVDGIAVNNIANYVWVLNNISYNNGADGIGGGHQADHTIFYVKNIFIGGNTIYANGENCIDLKGYVGVVVSENNCTGPAAREQGGGIVLHYGRETQSECVGPGDPWSCCTVAGGVGDDCEWPVDGAWIIFNTLYTMGGGTGTGGSNGCNNCWYIGNIFYDIVADYSPQIDESYSGVALQIGGSHGSMGVIDNTFYNCDTGVRIDGLKEGDSIKIHGNIFSHTTKAGPVIIFGYSPDDDYTDMDYNRFYYSGGTVTFNYVGTSRSLDYVMGTLSQCAFCTEGTPSFKSTTSSSASFLKLDTGSACIGTAESTVNTESTAYDAFTTLWASRGFSGLSIKKDYAGNTRPKETYWDIGAYEYDPATVRPAVSIGAGAGVSIGSGATMTLY
jgi:hypothetical protein